MPLADCHATPHTLIDAPTGELVSWSERESFRMRSTTLTALLATVDVRGIGPFDYDVRLYRYRYTTQDRGQPVDTTGMVAVPIGASPRPTPVALVLHHFAGILPGCAASEDAVRPLIPLLYAANGYYAVAPDYIGLSSDEDLRDQVHAPLVPEQIALASLDGLRAAKTLFEDVIGPSLPTPTTLRQDVLITGASQGGHGALVTAMLQPYYAPEWPTLAVVAAVPPNDVAGALREALQPGWNDATGLAFAVLTGMHRWYRPGSSPGDLFTEPVLEVLDPLLEDPTLDCDTTLQSSALPRDTDDVFHPDFLAAARAGDLGRLDDWGCFIGTASAFQLDPPDDPPPVLITYGTEDAVVPPASQLGDLERICEAGWSIEAVTCTDADHAQAGYWSFPEQFVFLQAAVDGDLPPSRCASPTPARCEGQP